MATFEITAPDGTKYHVEGPDGATEQDALAQVQAQHAKPAEAPVDPSVGGGEVLGIPTSQGVDRFLAGAGKAFTDLGRGAGQFLGVESRKDVADSRALDAPLMATGAGKAGNIAGNIAATAPAMAIPGAATVTGAAALGTAFGALQPSTSTKETLLNTGLGAASGALGQFTGNAISKAVGSRLAARQAGSAAQASQNSAKDAVLKTSQAAGYVVPPTAANPSMAATALESAGGKEAIRQQADVINQKITNKLIAKDLGIPENQPITRDALRKVRTVAGNATYGEIQKMGALTSDEQYKADLKGITQVGQDLEKAYPGIGSQVGEKVQALVKSLDVNTHDSGQALGLFKYLNRQARDNFKAARMGGGNPESLQLAQAQAKGVDAVGDLIKRNLANAGKPELAQQWDEARVLIAKSYQAQGALKGSNINAAKLVQQLRADKPLSGGFKTVADFADHFGEVTRVPKSGVGVNKLGHYVAGGGALTALATGHPGVAAAAIASPAASYGIHNALLSGAGQAALARPSYAPGMLGTGALNTLRLLRPRAPLALAGSNALVQSAQ